MADIDGPLDLNGHVAVGLPTNPLEAGFAQIGFVKTPTVARAARVSADGELRTAASVRLFDAGFNGGAAATMLNNQWNSQATTMTMLLQGGFIRFNNGSSVALNVGISMVSWQTFPIQDHSVLKLTAILRHVNGSVANKQADLGFGYYDIASGQNGAMNEFIGFRWTTGGGLIGVLDYSTGGSPTTIMVNLNGGVPLSDSVAHTYEVYIGEEGIDFYIDGEYEATISPQPDAPGLVKASGYPVIFRMYNSASAPPLAPVFDLGSVVVSRVGPIQNADRPTLQVAQGRAAGRAQAGTAAANGNNASIPASGTAPGALVPTNAVAGLVGLGGWGRATLTGVTATAHTELIMDSYLNPLVPEVVGALNNGRILVITDIMISPLIVSVVLAGGGFTAGWFLAYGHNGLSLATADAAGTTGPGTKSAVKVPLPIFDTLVATAAAGTIATRTGAQGLIPLQTPIAIAPGEYIALGLRTLFVTAAVTAGAVDCGIGFHGYWE